MFAHCRSLNVKVAVAAQGKFYNYKGIPKTETNPRKLDLIDERATSH